MQALQCRQLVLHERHRKSISMNLFIFTLQYSRWHNFTCSKRHEIHKTPVCAVKKSSRTHGSKATAVCTGTPTAHSLPNHKRHLVRAKQPTRHKTDQTNMRKQQLAPVPLAKTQGWGACAADPCLVVHAPATAAGTVPHSSMSFNLCVCSWWPAARLCKQQAAHLESGQLVLLPC